MKRNITFLACLFVLTACGVNNNPLEDKGVLLKDQTIDVEEVRRQYHLYLPENPLSAPIVFVFHGNGGSSNQVIGIDKTVAPHKVWLDIAKRENVVLVVPNGEKGSTGTQGWNDCRIDAPTNPNSDDVAFFETLLAYIQTRYNTVGSRVYAVGTSNGGKMVQRLADEVPEKLDAAAVLVTSRPINSACTESSLPLPILFMNGTDDPLVPYEGGQVASDRGEVLSTSETINYWVRRNGATTVATEKAIADTFRRDNSTITHFSYANSSGQSVVEHYEVLSGGHTEPSIQERYGIIFKLIVGNQNHDIEMAKEVWDFFRAHKRAR